MNKPTNDQIAKVFDKVASKYEQVVNPYTVGRRKRILVSWAKGKCLEIGAGSGELSLSLLKKGLTVVACDISPKMVKEIKKKGVEAYLADAKKLPFPDKSFDSLIASELVYYLDHPEKFIKEAYRVLRPEGRLLISSASASLTTNIYNRVRSLLRSLGFGRMYFDDPVTNFPSVSKLRALLKKGKFKISEEHKIVIFPFSSLHWLNNTLEKTPLNHLGVFILMNAKKVHKK